MWYTAFSVRRPATDGCTFFFFFSRESLVNVAKTLELRARRKPEVAVLSVDAVSLYYFCEFARVGPPRTNSVMSVAVNSPTRRRRRRSLLTSQSLLCVVRMRTALLLLLSSCVRLSTSFKAPFGQQQHHARDRYLILAVDVSGMSAGTGHSLPRLLTTSLSLQASPNELSQVTVEVKRSGRNPVDTSQVTYHTGCHLATLCQASRLKFGALLQLRRSCLGLCLNGEWSCPTGSF